MLNAATLFSAAAAAAAAVAAVVVVINCLISLPYYICCEG